MASNKMIAETISAIKVIYPYYSKEGDFKTLAKVWELTLRDYPDEVVEVALTECLKTCKMPPTPADIIDKVKALVNSNKPTDEELWGIFVKALRKIQDDLYYLNFPMQRADAHKHIQEVFNALPKELQRYAGSKGEFMRLADYGDDELKFEKNKFLKSIPQITEKVETQRNFGAYGIAAFEKILLEKE